jgi:alpha-L-fucosidase
MKLLLGTAGGDGNLLLNMGPRPDGRFEPTQVAVVRKMGQWLKQYGDSIYGTRGGPFKPGKFGVSTCKGNKIYVHISEFDGETVQLGKLPAKIVDARVMTGGECRFVQDESGVAITVAREFHRPIDTLVVLEVDTNAVAIPMIEPVAQAEEIDLGHQA